MKSIVAWITIIALMIGLMPSTFALNENQITSQNKTYFVSFHSNKDIKAIKDRGGQVKKEYKYIPVVAVFANLILSHFIGEMII